MDSSHAGHNLTLSVYSRLQPLANQLPAACLRHTKVPSPLAWNFDGGATEKSTRYKEPGTFFANGNAKKGGPIRGEWRQVELVLSVKNGHRHL